MAKTKAKKPVSKHKASADEQQYQRWLENLKPGHDVVATRFIAGYGDVLTEAQVLGIDVPSQLLFVKLKNSHEPCLVFDRKTGFLPTGDRSDLQIYAPNHPRITEPRARQHCIKIAKWLESHISVLPIELIYEILAVVDKYEAKKKA